MKEEAVSALWQHRVVHPDRNRRDGLLRLHRMSLLGEVECLNLDGLHVGAHRYKLLNNDTLLWPVVFIPVIGL